MENLILLCMPVCGMYIYIAIYVPYVHNPGECTEDFMDST